MNKIKKFIYILRIGIFRRKADRLAKKTGIQQFVLKINGNPAILSKAEFTRLRQHGLLKKTITAAELNKIALYHAK